LPKRLRKWGLQRVLIEGEFIGASEFAELKSACPEVELILTEQLVERARNVKDAAEQAALRKAIDLSAESFKEILPEIKPGVTERSLAAKLDYLFKVNGGDGPSFDTILASGLSVSLGSRGSF
jgi:Xaa-Pro aminopeptidase